MKIEVAYALEEEQFLFEEEVEAGTTVSEALKSSALLKKFPQLNIDNVGIFSQIVKPDQVLREGDRIEVYRPLKADPRDRRRKQVEEDRKKSS
ncbi:RnfH family protein [Hydrogenovibrio sp. 3SP14C1]|uniref:RnfH family protein n=1 Tax=Hydrogenovibrio sp. 3SP14C1 TaxID=3038774 RepID=UPI002417CA7A|nr:RnfH family protein [Hydrogenovibrio sp. 3SP14C1]MDG4812971.1 RnfH family protein [Hydrogenovibrio sp. 3SP14C1]